MTCWYCGGSGVRCCEYGADRPPDDVQRDGMAQAEAQADRDARARQDAVESALCRCGLPRHHVEHKDLTLGHPYEAAR